MALPPLSAEQQAVVDHPGSAVVVGACATGKTTALLARYFALLGDTDPSKILVLCRSRAGARSFRDAVLPRLAGGFDALPITTLHGLAFDTVTRARGAVRLLRRAEQRSEVGRQLADEDAAQWPALLALLRRRAFVDEVADAVIDLQASLANREEVLARAASADVADRWAELFSFSDRYRQQRAKAGEVDAAGLLVEAGELWAEAGDVSEMPWEHLLVDDLAPPSPVVERLVAQLARRCRTAVAADQPTVADQRPFAIPGATDLALSAVMRRDPTRRRIVCQHPSGEAEAVSGELLAAHAGGVAWSDMAVLVREPQRRAGALARAMARHGIPVALAPDLADDPIVRAFQDLLRDELEHRGSGDEAAVAFEIWTREFGHLVNEPGTDRALDAIVALLDGSAWRAQCLAAADAVSIGSIDAAAGREWHTVVIAGCVEGELPRIGGRLRYFDRALLDGEPPSVAERRRRSLAEERHLFCDVASTRATHELVAVAAPQPGVLPSRFIVDWPEADVRRPRPAGAAAIGRAPTGAEVSVLPETLSLSATKLETYAECPLRFAYHYGVHVPNEGSVYLDLGTLVHEILAEFCDPATSDRERSWDALCATVARHWRDDIAVYRPQVEEARRDLFEMLEQWWQKDGCQDPEVLAVEYPFTIEVAGREVRGQIDRIDRAADGVGIRILDYKTGRSEPRKGEAADNLQLAVYHLAATRDPQLAALGPPRALDLLFLRTMHVHSQPIEPDHAARTEARIVELADRMQAGAFDPSVTADCRTCLYHRLCPLQLEGREVSAAW